MVLPITVPRRGSISWWDIVLKVKEDLQFAAIKSFHTVQLNKNRWFVAVAQRLQLVGAQIANPTEHFPAQMLGVMNHAVHQIHPFL